METKTEADGVILPGDGDIPEEGICEGGIDP